MNARLSVVIPTRNPCPAALAEVLGGLRNQSLAPASWELLVVDNGSDVPLEEVARLDWHPYARIMHEETTGLTPARIRGFREARGDVIVLVDDDNVLGSDYLERATEIGETLRFLGAWGGVVRPRYEDARLAPPARLGPLLTLRDAAADLWSNDPDHHASTPWGAGLCVKAQVAVQYVRELEASEMRRSLDLSGSSLLYGGDTDIAYTACRMGLAKGVFARLRVEHIIPAARCTAEYLCRVAEGRGYTEVLHHVALHGRLPSERMDVASRLLKHCRSLRMPGIEGAVMRAHERGRRRAFRELGGTGR